jgi:hypothetical protein
MSAGRKARPEDGPELVTLARAHLCALRGEVMQDPVRAADGFVYERAAIEDWFSRHDTSPRTKAVTAKALEPLEPLRATIAAVWERVRRRTCILVEDAELVRVLRGARAATVPCIVPVHPQCNHRELEARLAGVRDMLHRASLPGVLPMRRLVCAPLGCTLVVDAPASACWTTLALAIRAMPHGRFRLRHALVVVRALADVLAGVHAASLCAGALRPDNVILDAENAVFLADISVTRAVLAAGNRLAPPICTGPAPPHHPR